MKKLIVFCIFGADPKYTETAYDNLVLQAKFYPDWTCRFYVDETVPDYVVTKLSHNAEIVQMPKSDGFYGMWWRFEPLKDTTLERFIVRDTDSLLLPKEVAAVKEWEESGLKFHIMRDHRYHQQFIMGGMWGATSKFINEYKDDFEKDKADYFSKIGFNEVLHSTGKYYQTDQIFLQRYIWPRIVNCHLAHVADRPNLKYTGAEKMFPIEDPDGLFVGYQEYMRKTPGYLQQR